MINFLVRCVGGILLVAFVLKVIDDFFWLKLTSPIFAAAVLLDLIVGCLLTVSPIARASCILGGTLYFLYSVFQVVFWGQTCDCLGNLSSRLDSYTHIGVTVFCAIVCFGAAIMRSWPILFRAALSGLQFQRMLLLGASLILSVSLLKNLRTYEPLVGFVENGTNVDDGKISGVLRLFNRSQTAVSILGSYSSKCHGGIGLDEPIVIEGGSFYDLPSMCVPTSRSIFDKGTLKVFVALGDKARLHEFPWIAHGRLRSSRP